MKKITPIIVIISLLVFSNSPLFSLPARAATCDNLVSWWSLDESSDGSGAVARADSVVASANNLTDNNTTASAVGKVSNGADFELANSETLSIADAAQTGLDITGDISFAFWVKPETINTLQNVINKWGDATTRSYKVSIDAANTLTATYSSNGTSLTEIATNAAQFAAATWAFVVVTIDVSASTGVVYINGSSVAVTPSGTDTAIFNSASAFYLSSQNGTERYYDGLMDEVGIWSRILTADEVTALYNSGNGVSYATACAAAGTATPQRPAIIQWQ